MDVEYQSINFTGFEEVRTKLKEIKRYSNMETMFYRTNVLEHSKNVFFLLKETMPKIRKIYKMFDEEKSLIMAAIHDDTEILIGDFQAGNKAKLTSEELEKLNQKELDAIEKMCETLPKSINGYNYKSLLLEIFHMNTVEATVVKYLDRFDAYGESCHEVFAGNTDFTTHVENEFGKIELPTHYYITRFNDYENTYPLMKDLVEFNKIPFLKKYGNLRIENIVRNKKPHTNFTLSQKTISLEYNFWKLTLVKHGFEKKLLNKVE